MMSSSITAKSGWVFCNGMMFRAADTRTVYTDTATGKGGHRVVVETVLGEKLWPFYGSEAECKRRIARLFEAVAATQEPSDE